MTPDEQKRIGQALAALVQRCILGKRWLRWPPGPMLGQVFDYDLCHEDIRSELTKFTTLPDPQLSTTVSNGPLEP